MSSTLYKIGLCVFMAVVPFSLGGAALWAFCVPKRRSFRCVLAITAIVAALGWRLVVNPDSRRYMMSLAIPGILLAAYFCFALPFIAGRWIGWLRKNAVILSVLMFLSIIVPSLIKDLRFNRHSDWLTVVCGAYSECSANAPDRKLYLPRKEKMRCGYYLPKQRDGELREIPDNLQSAVSDYRKTGRKWRDFLADFRHYPYPCYLLMDETPECRPLSEVNDIPGLEIRLCAGTFTSRKQDNLVRLYEVRSREAGMKPLDGGRLRPLPPTAAIPNGDFERPLPPERTEQIRTSLARHLASAKIDSLPDNWSPRILYPAPRYFRPVEFSLEHERAISGKNSCRISADALVALVGVPVLPRCDYHMTFRARALQDSHFAVRISYSLPVPERVCLADFRLGANKCIQVAMPIFRSDFLHPMKAFLTFYLMSGEILLDDIVVTQAAATESKKPAQTSSNGES